jgi:hypothetical protein
MNKAPTEREGEREREREQTNLKEMGALLEEVLHCCFGPDLGFVCFNFLIVFFLFFSFLSPFFFFFFFFLSQ